jgi:hypothetical protein
MTAERRSVARPGESVASTRHAMTVGPHVRAATLQGKADGTTTLGQLAAKAVQ